MRNVRFGCLTSAGVAALVGLVALYVYMGSFYNDHWRTCTVVSKDRGATSSSQSNYRIYTKECGTLGDGDSWLRGKTNSADIYGELQPGHVYRLETVGYRSGLTSHFPNILGVKAVQ